MNESELEDLAALDAVGALGPADRLDLRAHLGGASPQLRERIGALYDVALLLTLGLPPTVPPGSGVRRRLMGRLAGEHPDEPGVHVIPAGEGRWEPGSTEMVRIKRLGGGLEEGHVVLLMEMAPGAQFGGRSHVGAEECFVVDGDVVIGGRRLAPGDFQHAEPGTVHPPMRSLQGCRLLFIVSALDFVERWTS